MSFQPSALRHSLKESAGADAQAEACASKKSVQLAVVRRQMGRYSEGVTSGFFFSFPPFALRFMLFPVTPDADPGSTASSTIQATPLRGFRRSPE